MRKTTLLTQARFARGEEVFCTVALPHTWNAQDGQDGGNDYWRGTGHYEIDLPAPTTGMRQYIEIQGANHMAFVSCNGKPLGQHEGGFSTFRFEITDTMQKENNLLQVDVSNAASHIYPQDADFTFFGGLYRNVCFIEVPDAHFDLMKDGSDGVFVSAFASGAARVDLFPVNAENCYVQLELVDQENNLVFTQTQPATAHTIFETAIKNAHLWQATEDPYCYTARATLMKEGVLLDQVCVTYGYRSFRVDAERGFFLNGKHTPLRGVCRHQDRYDKGWAISREDHEEDARLIRQIGANTVRLAHYQHDAYFYQLCDKLGFAVWAEVPFISALIPGEKAHANILSQMKELIAQCYNHPSIVVWGIGNEITIRGNSEEIYRNLCDLNALAKAMDPHRLTTIAHLTRLPATDPQVQITDIQSYNHYQGWYTATVQDCGPVLDDFRKVNPNRALGLSEYGADCVPTWHSAFPFNHDYTEEYACYYHHEMLKTITERPYLWATHAWNMFDFAVDSRNEGGISGRNNKGLITYDRKTKKDTFYLYQAYWTSQPMVHIAGRRFSNRAPGERDITVYTNCEEVTLSLNGAIIGSAKVTDHAAVFSDVALADGENTLTAIAGNISDTISLWGVAQHDGSYDLPDLANAIQAGNWFSQQEGLPDYGEKGYHLGLPLGVLLSNRECYEIIRGSIMALQHLDISIRYRFVAGLDNFRDNPGYNTRLLPDMPTPKTYLTEEDFARLEKRLRSVKRT